MSFNMTMQSPSLPRGGPCKLRLSTKSVFSTRIGHDPSYILIRRGLQNLGLGIDGALRLSFAPDCWMRVRRKAESAQLGRRIAADQQAHHVRATGSRRYRECRARQRDKCRASNVVVRDTRRDQKCVARHHATQLCENVGQVQV